MAVWLSRLRGGSSRVSLACLPRPGLLRPGRCVASAFLALSLAAPALAAPAAGALPPLRIGVGGMFPAGFEGICSRLGLPHERIDDADLADAAVLKRYDVVLVSSPSPSYPGAAAALRQYVESGGRALVEMWHLGDRTLLPTPVVGIRGPDQLAIADTSTTISRGYEQGSMLGTYDLGSDTVAEGLAGEKVIARYRSTTHQHGDGQPALVLFRPGAGEALFAGPPLGFATSARGPALEQLALNAIEYLCGGKADPRFILAEPVQPAEGGAAPPQPATPNQEPPAVAQPPAGMAEIDPPAGDLYDVLADVEPSAETSGEPAEIVLDYLSPKHYAAVWFDRLTTLSNVEGKIGADRCALVLASSKQREVWEGPWPAGERTLIVKRRPGWLELATADQVLTKVRYEGRVLGRAYLRPMGRGVKLSNAVCQELDQPFFTDDFMREPNEPNPWHPKTGTWSAVGLNNPVYSVNGFTYVGKGSPALATAGEWFWEDYACSVAVQPLDDKASVGLAANYHEAGSYLLFRLTPGGKAEIVRVAGAAEEVLASTAAGLAPRQWYRPGLRVADGTIEAFVDGEPVLKCPDPTAGCGAVALWVSGGSASFDDMEVLPAARANGERLPPANDEGTDNATLPINVGALDKQTWASQAVPWVAQPERPSLLWHKGAYFGDVMVRLLLRPAIQRSQEASLILAPAREADRGWRLTARREPKSPRVQVELLGRGKTVARKAVLLPKDAPGELELARIGKRVVARWCGKALATGSEAGGDHSVGLELTGAAIYPADLTVASPNARDYTFAAAPSDWWTSSGDWEVTARWACDERWSWLCGQSDAIAAAWNKHRFAGDVVLDYYMAVKHKGPGGDETLRARDLNAALCGDGKDPNSGYSFVLGGDGGVVTSILKQGKVVAENPKARVPPGYAVHHQWHHIQVAKIGDTLTFALENRPVLTWTDPQPLQEGYVGVWTRHSAIMLPRVTIYFEREAKGPLLGLAAGPAQSGPA